MCQKETNSFPQRRGWCENPKCIYIRERVQKRFQKYEYIGEKLFEDFLAQDNPQDFLDYSNHAERRFINKSINTARLFNEVIENGYVIDFNNDNNVVTVMGYMKIGKGMYRPLHIPMELTRTKKGVFAIIITAYDPKFSSHLYDETLEKRVCFCQPHEL